MATTEPWQPLSQERRDELEKRLKEERARALKDLEHISDRFTASSPDADGDLTSYPFHMADRGTDTMEEEKSFLLASQEGRLVWQIDEALRKLYADPDNFGRCSNCGRAIGDERLDALPYTQLCITCAEKGVGSAAGERAG